MAYEPCKDCGCTDMDEWWMTLCHRVLTCKEAAEEDAKVKALELQLGEEQKTNTKLIDQVAKLASRVATAERLNQVALKIISGGEHHVAEAIRLGLVGSGHEYLIAAHRILLSGFKSLVAKVGCPKCQGKGAYLEAPPGSDEPIPYPCEVCAPEKRKDEPVFVKGLGNMGMGCRVCGRPPGGAGGCKVCEGH